MQNVHDLELRPYRESDWEALREFNKANWREDHPFCKRALFDWQFKGFGNANKKINSLVLLQNNHLVGFRGVIPGLYQVPSEKHGMRVVQGGSLAMWMLRQDLRGGRVGLMMHLEAQKSMAVITGAGSDPKTSVPIYVQNGFSLLAAMHRYVVPLHAQGYHQLLAQKVDVNHIEAWAEVWTRCQQAVEPSEPDVDAIAAVWEETTFPLQIFSLYRNSEFWKWRYLESTGFRYLFFGNARDTGLIVARTETISSKEITAMNGQKVLRIIEILPRNTQAWEGEIDTRLIELMRGVILWAMRQGCLAADFYCSTRRFAPILQAVGFREQDMNCGPRICTLALCFQPLKYIVTPINALFRIEMPGEGIMKLDFENTYHVKSDNDMDRPNIYDYEELVQQQV